MTPAEGMRRKACRLSAPRLSARRPARLGGERR